MPWKTRFRPQHLIEVSNDDTDDTDDEDETVATNGIVVCAKALGEEVEAWVDLVLADGLEYSWCTNKGSNS